MNRLVGWTLGLLAVATSSPAILADSVLERADATARERFQTMLQTYQALPYYEDHGALTRVVRFGDQEQTQVTPIVIQFARPNRLLLKAGEIEIVANGDVVKTVLHPMKRFRERPSPDRLRYNEISDGAAGAMLFGGFVGPPTQLLLKAILGQTGNDALPDRTSGLKVGEDRAIDGTTYECLILEQGEEPSLRVFLDPQTHLVRMMEFDLNPDMLAEKLPAGPTPVAMTLKWVSGEILTVLPEQPQFALDHPEAYQPIVAARPKAAPAAAVDPRVGKLAPDFRLDVLTGADGSRMITREDLKGKIVILDFWATWCGPCLLELPEIQSLAEDLAKAKAEDVAIFAVSQDRKPDGETTVRKLVEDLLESKKLKIGGGPISQVALDPDQANGELFGIEALPTLVVIDAQGVVQAVHVGFDEDIKSTLTEEIGQLRQGKPVLPKP